MSFKVERVMLVDDNEIDNFVTRRVMEGVDFAEDVVVMTSGKGALDFIEENKNSIENLPDIIFLDLNMPIVDGFLFLYEFDDFSDAIKEKCNIVVLSSVIEQTTIDKILKNEYVFDFIPKPITEDALNKLAESFSIET